LKESTASGCCDDEAPLLPSARPVPDDIADVVDAEFGWCRTLSSDVVVDKVAATLSRLFEFDLKSCQIDRGPLLSTCRESAAKIRATLRFTLHCTSLCFCYPFQLPVFILFQFAKPSVHLYL